MEQSPPWEANRFSASQDVPPILQNPKVHYRIHKCLRPVPILSHSIRSISPHPTSWRSILISSHLGSPKLSLSLRFPHQNPVYASPLPLRATCPYYLFLNFITRIMFGEEYRSLSTSLCSFLHYPCYLFPLRPNYSPQHPILKHPQPTIFPQYERPSFTPTQNNRQNYISVYLNLLIFE